jgi:2-polyprenyl-3-methyl-5-hydroxy-6-metoxy-1,4-benzoquinol methylase
MKTWQERWMDRFYRRAGWVDGTNEFHALCDEFIVRGARILEVGAGPANVTSAFLSSHGELHGVDVGSEILENPHPVRRTVIVGDSYPYDPESFDAVVSNYVVEHVRQPGAHLAEIRRVLKPGGVYLFRTPNLFHYVALVSWLTPQWFHRLVANRLRRLPAGTHDPWPTVYSMNTRGSVRRWAAKNGFEIRVLRMVEKEPSYGKFARPAFLAFMSYERFVNSSSWFSGLRANMFCCLEKHST